MIDKTYCRNEISASLTYFKVRRTEHRECAIIAIQLNGIGAALNQLRKLNGLKAMYAQSHGRKIKSARWK